LRVAAVDAAVSAIIFDKTSSGARSIETPRFIRALVYEIRRRKVLRVTAVYAVSTWLILQVAEVTLDPLGFPSWTMRALIIGTIIGFPITIFLGWIIEIRPEGLIFDLPLWRGLDPEQPREQRKSDYVAALALLVALISLSYIAVDSLEIETPKRTNADSSLDAPPNSVAVLAFSDFSEGQGSEYFGGGLAEEILNLLAGVNEMNVAARTSSFQFRNQEIGIREIARRLGVRHVLEGSVRRDGDRIRVVAQLIDADDGYHVFSNDYERDLEDIFSIQQEIAAAVVNEMQIALSVDSERRLRSVPTDDIDAYVYYLQGIERLRRPFDLDVMRATTELFDRAIEMDPAFSRAHAGNCEAFLQIYELSRDTDDFLAAEQACERSADLDPGLTSEVHLALGKLYRYRGDEESLEQSEAHLERARSISPTMVDVYIELGELRASQGNMVEAEAQFVRARELKRNYWKSHEALGTFYYNNGRYQDAAASYEMAASLAPESAAAYASLGAAYYMLGDSERTRSAYQESLKLKETRQVYTNLGMSYYYDGLYEEAAKYQDLALKFAGNDHRVWGRLAESYRFVPGKEAESMQAYQEAARLAEENRAVETSAWRTIGLLGLYYAHLRRTEESLDHVDQAVQISGGNAEAYYFQSLARLEAGDTDGAVESLSNAVSRNAEYASMIESDPDLQALRGDPRVSNLLSGPGQ
jgi:TolB-like protein/Flp pilus assembly protein TadD